MKRKNFNFKKLKGKAIEISYPRLFDSGINGIIKSIEGNYIILDYCDSGNKIQYINLDKIESFSILNEKEKKELIEYYGDKKK